MYLFMEILLSLSFEILKLLAKRPVNFTKLFLQFDPSSAYLLQLQYKLQPLGGISFLLIQVKSIQFTAIIISRFNSLVELVRPGGFYTFNTSCTIGRLKEL